MQDIPKFVLKRLQEKLDPESHPDVDLLTAFAERSLLESERATVTEHLARCGECREVVALALPATEDLAMAVSTNPTRSSWSRWSILRWGIAAVAIVAITSVGILQYRQRHLKTGILESVLVPRDEKNGAAQLAIQAPPASSELQVIGPETKNGEQANSRKKVQSNRRGTSAVDTPTRSWNQSVPPPRGGQAAGSGISGAVMSGSGGGQVPAAAEPAPSPNVSEPAVVASSAETVEVESQAAAAVPMTESRLSDQLIQNQKEQLSKDKSPTDLDAVKVSPRWSISSVGMLQRSLDAGNTWVDINPELAPSRSKLAGIAGNTNEVKRAKENANTQRSPSAVFRALSAFGTEVWVGGSAAMLYHSGDSGAHWTRIRPSSSGATLNGDITSIEFSDPQQGRVATSQGEIWITVDDGQTWRRQ